MRQRPARLVLAGCVAAILSLGTALAGVPASAGADDRSAAAATAQSSVDRAKKPKSLVQFLSKDGTAETGTTTTFTLTSGTGAALRIPVIGQGPKTSYSQVVKPGKYTVTSEPSILNGATYTVSKLAPESGVITVARREESVRLPARGLLVLAANPCPCGNFSNDPRLDECRCSDPVRRALVARLSRGAATVNELAAPFAITKQAVSKHIRVLEEAGLVTRTRDAQRRPVHLDAGALEAMTAWIDRYRLDAERNYRQLDQLLAEKGHPR